MVRSSIALLVLLVAGTAGAQASTITVSRPFIDKTTCDANAQVIISVQAQDNNVPSRPVTNLTIASQWTIWVSSTGTCTETNITDAALLTDSATVDVGSAAAGTYTLTVGAQTIVGAVDDQDINTCGGTTGVNKQRNVCAKYTGTTPFPSTQVSVDTRPLEAPTITAVAVGDHKVRLRVNPPSGQDITGYQAFYRLAFCEGSSTSGVGSGGAGAGGGGAGGTGGSGGSGGSGPTGEICGNGKDDDADGAVDCKDPECAGQLRALGGTEPTTLGFTQYGSDFGPVDTVVVQGLVNGSTYQLFVIALRASDKSPGSNVVNGAPRATTTFFEAYRADGGQETGCSAAPPLGLAGILGLLLRRARRRGSR